MSKILVDTIDTRSGTTTLTLGSTNAGTIALGSGDVQSNFLQPAFEAFLGSDQTISDNSATKVQCGTEVYDTASAYDNAANYRFTVPSGKAGKYYFYGGVKGQSSSTDTIEAMSIYLYKNGAQARRNEYFQTSSNDATIIGASINQVLDLVAGDYVELYGIVNVSSGTPRFDAGGTGGATYFGAYRIGT
tara:strand:+ start:424 stop:990 length:567 start_codon:yes stop_codon:yes gene_type:complete